MTTITDRDAVVAFFAELAVTRPSMHARLVRLGALQVRAHSPCAGCGAHSLVPCEPGCRVDAADRLDAFFVAPLCEACGKSDHTALCPIGGVMATYQGDGR